MASVTFHGCFFTGGLEASMFAWSTTPLRLLPIVNILFVHWQSWQLVCITSGQLAVAIRLKDWYFNEFSSQPQNLTFSGTCLILSPIKSSGRNRHFLRRSLCCTNASYKDCAWNMGRECASLPSPVFACSLHLSAQWRVLLTAAFCKDGEGLPCMAFFGGGYHSSLQAVACVMWHD